MQVQEYRMTKSGSFFTPEMQLQSIYTKASYCRCSTQIQTVLYISSAFKMMHLATMQFKIRIYSWNVKLFHFHAFQIFLYLKLVLAMNHTSENHFIFQWANTIHLSSTGDIDYKSLSHHHNMHYYLCISWAVTFEFSKSCIISLFI